LVFLLLLFVFLGTENVPYIVALGKASEMASMEWSENMLRYLSLKLKFLKQLHFDLGKAAMESSVVCNGPVRSNTIQTLEEDLKMLKVLVKKDGNSSKLTTSSSTADDMIEQLPNTVSVAFKNLVGHEIVHNLANKVAISAGSACHSVDLSVSSASAPTSLYTPSEVLQAIGISSEYGVGTIRISFGRYSTEEEAHQTATEIATTVTKMWQEKNLLVIRD
jgi:cysteine sulfinate desulfinase/cysteine desulfurase-like protein